MGNNSCSNHGAVSLQAWILLPGRSFSQVLRALGVCARTQVSGMTRFAVWEIDDPSLETGVTSGEGLSIMSGM